MSFVLLKPYRGRILVLGMLSIGLGFIFFVVDRRNSRMFLFHSPWFRPDTLENRLSGG